MSNEPITDAEILQWILDGSLVVGLDNPTTILNRGRSSKCYLIGNDSSRSSGAHRRWAFGLFRNGRRRTIVRSKLVYLAGTKKLIPENYQIHHIDENRLNDAFDNLKALHKDDHAALHLTDLTDEFLNGL